MPYSARTGYGLLSMFITGLLIACATRGDQSMARETRADDAARAEASSGGGPVDTIEDDIEAVKRATDRFQDLEAAIVAGYSTQYPAGCMESSDGAQGFHYLNESLVDNAVELLEPELVMYELQEDGSYQLVGVDYVVPFDVWRDDEPPTLLDQKFARNEKLGVWALHIWAWRDNPSGMFAAWNPRVSCANDAS